MVTLFINGENAETKYGAILGESGLTALLVPPPNKAYLENKSAVEDGKEVLVNDALPAHVDERTLRLAFIITASNTEQLMQRFATFTEVLRKGKVRLSTSFQPNVIYNLYYTSCGELVSHLQHAIKINVNFVEPNPNNRV